MIVLFQSKDFSSLPEHKKAHSQLAYALVVFFTSVFSTHVQPRKAPAQHDALRTVRTTTQSEHDATLPHYLIIGAERNLGYALLQTLLSKNIPVAVLTFKKEKVLQCLDTISFEFNPRLITIIEGLVEKDVELVQRACTNKKYIFFTPHFPYKEWATSMASAADNVLKAAHADTTIIFPSSIYSIGKAYTPVTEEIKTKPCSEQGKVFDLIERKFLENKNSKSLVLRTAPCFGPNLINGFTDRPFKNALKREPLQWVYTTDNPLQLAYSLDVAELMLCMVHDTDLPSGTFFHYSGEEISSTDSWLTLIAQSAGMKNHKTSLDGWFSVCLSATIQNTAARACKDIFYTFELTVKLDDTRIRKHYLNFKPTPLSEATKKTYEWFLRDIKKQEEINTKT